MTKTFTVMASCIIILMQIRVEKVFESQFEGMANRSDYIIGQPTWTLKNVAGTPMLVVLGHIGNKVLDISIATACEAYVLHGVLQKVLIALAVRDFEALYVDL